MARRFHENKYAVRSYHDGRTTETHHVSKRDANKVARMVHGHVWEVRYEWTWLHNGITRSCPINKMPPPVYIGRALKRITFREMAR